MDRRTLLKAGAALPLVSAFKSASPVSLGKSKMSKPVVITVPANGKVQIPLGDSNVVTLVNQSSTFPITLCNDDIFNPNTTWPLEGGSIAPQTGVNNLWAFNGNTIPIQLLVYTTVVPITYTPNAIGLGGLYKTVSTSIHYGVNTIILPDNLPYGQAYKLHSLALLADGLTSSACAIEIDAYQYLPYGDNTIYAKAFPSGVYIADSYNFNGLIVHGSVQGTMTYAGGLTFANINYDVINL